jgi:hypothetical protein
MTGELPQKAMHWIGDGRECYMVESSSGVLYHAHNNSTGWSVRKVTLSTLDHHTSIYNRPIIERQREWPDGLADALADTLEADAE